MLLDVPDVVSVRALGVAIGDFRVGALQPRSERLLRGLVRVGGDAAGYALPRRVQCLSGLGLRAGRAADRASPNTGVSELPAPTAMRAVPQPRAACTEQPAGVVPAGAALEHGSV